MSERITLTGSEASDSESNSEKDSSDSKTEKKGSKKSREIGSIIAGAEKTAEKVEKKEKIAKESASLLDKIFNPERQNAESKPSEADREQNVERSEILPEEPALSAHEEQVAHALAGEGEIDLRGISPERDEDIVDHAVEMATEKQLPEMPQAEAFTTAEAEPSEPPEATLEPALETVAETASELPEESEVEENDDAVVTAGASSSSSSRPMSSTSTSSHSTASSAYAGSAGSGGTLPPMPPTPPASTPPPTGSPRRPSFPSRHYAPGTTYTAPPAPASVYTAPSTANTAVTPAALTGAIEDAEHYAYRRGRNKGLVTGLIVGGGIEHIRHKRREKKMERKFAVERKAVDKKIENQRWDQIRETEAEKVREQAAERYRSIEHSSAVIRPAVVQSEQLRSANEVVRQRAEIKAEIEQKMVEEHKEVARVATKAEQIEQQRQQEQLEIARGHHIERSAWHNIEVDTHGRAVQETALEYGHEYYKERAQEIDPLAKQQVDSAAGEVALVAAALSSGGSSSGDGSSSGGQPTQLSATAVKQTAPKSTFTQPKSVLKTITEPPTTPAGTFGWFIALVVLLVVLGFVVF